MFELLDDAMFRADELRATVQFIASLKPSPLTHHMRRTFAVVAIVSRLLYRTGRYPRPFTMSASPRFIRATSFQVPFQVRERPNL